MKKIKTNISIVYTAFFLMLCIFSSCEDFLSKTPLNSTSSENFWNNKQDVDSWMHGIYNGLVNDLGGNIQFWGDARSDNLFPTGYSSGSRYQFNGLTSTESQADWSKLYSIIGGCNTAIEKIPNVPGLDNISYSMAMGESYGIRALMYFYIARVWGGGPLVLKTWDGSSATKYNPRASINDIAAAIESDINLAIDYLTIADREEVCYFTLGAALTLKMDFLTWRGRYSEVPAVYDNLTSLNKYSIITTVRDWNKIFTEPANSSEAIFSLVWDIAKNDNARSPFARNVGWGGSGSGFSISKEIFDLMVRDTMDIRLWGAVRRNRINGKLEPASAPVYLGSNGDIQQIDKFWPLGEEYGTFVISNEVFDFPAPIYRFADAKLLYAEALNRTGDGQGAIDIVNEIRASRGSSVMANIADYPQAFGNSNNSREKLIMDERQLEFWEEGKRWFDLLRLDWGYEVVDAHVRYLQYYANYDVTGFGNKNRMLFPIFHSNLSANPLLTQNPGF